MTYSFNEHKHRYAVWTAARAVQRSFTTTNKVQQAINATTLRQFCESNNSVSQEEFDSQHTLWCNTIIECLAKDTITCTYGRAAKIVAIYLKTSYILPNGGNTETCLVIHPPIDSILLRALAQEDGLKDLGKMRWTRFDENPYWELVQRLRKQFNSFDWRLEEFWKPEKEDTLIKKKYKQ